MRLGFLTLMATVIPAVLAAAEPESLPNKASPAADSAVLEKKLAELKVLQAEIRKLRGGKVSDQAIVISLQMLEVSPKPSEKAESDLGGTQPGLVGDGDESTQSPRLNRQRIEAGMVLDRRQLQERLAQWCEKGIVKVVAEPKIATVSGRPAQFQVGGMFPVPDKTGKCVYREYGTRIDVVPTADEDGSVRLELRARQSCLDHKYEVVVEGQKLPGLSVREIDTAAKLLPEEVLVVGTFAGNRSDAQRSSDAIVPDSAEKADEKRAFIVLVQIDLTDTLPGIEPEGGSTAQGSGHSEVPSARAPRRTSR